MTGSTNTPPPKLKFEENARFVRYNLLGNACQRYEINHLLLAHHMDDQIETCLMRLAKASGIEGMAGMRPLSRLPAEGYAHLKVARPLLDIRKAELIRLCMEEDVQWFEDPTNADITYSRNMLRAFVAAIDVDPKLTLNSERIISLVQHMNEHRDEIEKRGEPGLAATRLTLQVGSYLNEYLIDVIDSRDQERRYVFFKVPPGIPRGIQCRMLIRTLEKWNGRGQQPPRLDSQMKAVSHLVAYNLNRKAFTLRGILFSPLTDSHRMRNSLKMRIGSDLAERVLGQGFWQLLPQPK